MKISMGIKTLTSGKRQVTQNLLQVTGQNQKRDKRPEMAQNQPMNKALIDQLNNIE